VTSLRQGGRRRAEEIRPCDALFPVSLISVTRPALLPKRRRITLERNYIGLLLHLEHVCLVIVGDTDVFDKYLIHVLRHVICNRCDPLQMGEAMHEMIVDKVQTRALQGAHHQGIKTGETSKSFDLAFDSSSLALARVVILAGRPDR